MIDLKNLNKSFSQGERSIEVLKNLSLNLGSGETLAVLGQSGSGKSTLLSLLAGIDRPDSGEIILEGQNLALLTEKELTRLRSKKIGIIFQQFHLLPHLSALENVTLPLEILDDHKDFKKNVEEATKCLEEVGLKHRLDHFPSQLSGGEKQRVAIARSLIIGPDLILADEPSGSLDEKTGGQVMELIFSLVKSKGKSMILVTHNKALAKSCDRTLMLEGGKLHALEVGP